MTALLFLFYLLIFIKLNGCQTDNGGISVLIEKLSERDVSFVDMTAGEVKKDSRKGELGVV